MTSRRAKVQAEAIALPDKVVRVAERHITVAVTTLGDVCERTYPRNQSRVSQGLETSVNAQQMK